MRNMILLARLVLLAQFASLLSTLSLSGDNSLKFLVLGDWGGLPFPPYSTDRERQLADTMNEVSKQSYSRFQIALGDNFFFKGVENVTDKRFQETFENVFTGAYLQNDWYFVAGNYDWYGNVTAQIAYSCKSPRWNFPDFYYSKTFVSPDGATVQLVMIDTVILSGKILHDFSPMGCLEPIIPKKQTEDHWRWIQDTLADSTADYVLVGGHYPVYSISRHGPTPTLVTFLRPLLLKYNVTAYLCGHDHNLQHLHETISSDLRMDYFIIGAANFVDDNRKHEDDVPQNSLKFYNADKDGGFAGIKVTSSQMSVTFISGKKEELYQVLLKPRDGVRRHFNGL